MNAHIIKQPLITEKMSMLQNRRQYAFEVDIDANKIEIQKAIEKKFNVDVESVRTIRVKGKSKTQLTRRGRFEGRKPNWKKAIVTLKEGQEIDFFKEG
jgi:large subunit ribosomal protein L23